MPNLVNEIEALKTAIDLEVALRRAVERVMTAGTDSDTIRGAHEMAVAEIVDCARALLIKADP